MNAPYEVNPAPLVAGDDTATRRNRLESGDIPAEFWWKIRYEVALVAALDVNCRIDQHHLRVRVVEHLAACWWHAHLHGGHPDGFTGFLLDYSRDVERDADPGCRDIGWELHRVWTNHAALLGGEVDAVHPRP